MTHKTTEIINFFLFGTSAPESDGITATLALKVVTTTGVAD